MLAISTSEPPALDAGPTFLLLPHATWLADDEQCRIRAAFGVRQTIMEHGPGTGLEHILDEGVLS